MQYTKEGTTWSFLKNNVAPEDTLPVGVYTLCQASNGALKLEEAEPFQLPPVLYGNTLEMGTRILNTYQKKSSVSQTGVILTGTKGSGKTLLAKWLAVNSGFPTILVNTAFTDDHFVQTIQDIDQPAVLIFDEFEKVYDSDAQEAILTLFDGVCSSPNKLVVLTCNDSREILDFFKNRPSRIRYLIEFNGLEQKFIQEYCRDKLLKQEYLDDILDLSLRCIDFNFDMLQVLVDELNMYGGNFKDTIAYLNIKPPYNYKAPAWPMSIVDTTSPETRWETRFTLRQSPMTHIAERGSLDFSYNQVVKPTDQGGEEPEVDSGYCELNHEDLVYTDTVKGCYYFATEHEDQKGQKHRLLFRISHPESLVPSTKAKNTNSDALFFESLF